MEILLKKEDGINCPLSHSCLKQVARKALLRLGYNKNTELSLYLVDDPTMRGLNHKYRGKDKVTDVLSFEWPEDCTANMGETTNLGDIVISVTTASRYAERKGHGLNKELVVLLIHGILHLAGFDHEGTDGRTSAIMLGIQEQLLGEVFQEWKD